MRQQEIVANKMDKIKNYYSLYIDTSENRGRGVFTDENIPEDSLIEISPVIEITNTDENTVKYIYLSSENTKKYLSLGYAGLYNHSDNENVFAKVDVETDTIRVTSKRDIKRGEELFINYGYRLDYFV